MTTKTTIEGYFASLKQKKGWDSFLADDMVFTSFTSPVKQVTGKAAYLESTKCGVRLTYNASPRTR